MVMRIIGGRINESLMYWSSVEGPNRRGRPLGRWEDRVKEYMSERGVRGKGLEWARVSVWIGRGGGHLLWPPPWGTLPEGARSQSY